MNIENSAYNSLESEYDSKLFEGYYQAERHEMLEFVPNNIKTVLDVGCSNGYFGKLLKQIISAEVWGIEPNKKAAETAAREIDKVICSVFHQNLDLPESYFDCIVFNDVLEHLINPQSALKYCHKLLTKKGIIVASIPNVRYFDNLWNLLILKKWEYTDFGILDKTHLRFFTYRSIEHIFQNTGYLIEQLKGINLLDTCDPHHLRKFKVLNYLLLNKISDTRYLQFAVVARPFLQ